MKKRWIENNPAHAEWKRQYTAAHAVENLARVRAWKAANPERSAELHRRKQMNRSARKRGSGRYEPIDQLVVLERDDGVCGICGGDVDPMDYHVDHIIPLARGGEHTYANVQTTHPSCNVAKGARLDV
jgi:5-methylcytosine-specific restriction endonuclease McrA